MSAETVADHSTPSPRPRANALAGLRVCHFGTLNPNYIRNQMTLRMLRRAGAEVVPIHGSALRRNPLLAFAESASLLARAARQRFGLILVGFPGLVSMPAATLLGRLNRAPVVLDALCSQYDHELFDVRSCTAHSPMAKARFAVEKIAYRLADLTLLDTDERITYVSERFDVPRSLLARIWVGADEAVMYPRPLAPHNALFTAYFYGTYTHLHGIEHIVEAARVLRDRGESVRFIVVGSGSTRATIQQRVRELGLENLELVEKVPFAELAEGMARSDVCLGVFGTTPTVHRSIPSKIFDALAMAKPLITADALAVRGAFTYGQHLWLVPPGDGARLAEAILTLKRDDALRERLAREGRRAFVQRFSTDAMVPDLVAALQRVLPARSAPPGPAVSG